VIHQTESTDTEKLESKDHIHNRILSQPRIGDNFVAIDLFSKNAIDNSHTSSGVHGQPRRIGSDEFDDNHNPLIRFNLALTKRLDH
jgi:hypothetical protein